MGVRRLVCSTRAVRSWPLCSVVLQLGPSCLPHRAMAGKNVSSRHIYDSFVHTRRGTCRYGRSRSSRRQRCSRRPLRRRAPTTPSSRTCWGPIRGLVIARGSGLTHAQVGASVGL